LRLNKKLQSSYTQLSHIIDYPQGLKERTPSNTAPTITKLKNKLIESQILEAKDRNNALPQLDLELEYLSPGIETTLSKSLDQSANGDFQNTTISLNFKWIFGNNKATASHQIQKLKLKKINYEIIEKEKDLEFEKQSMKFSIADLQEQEKLLAIQKSLWKQQLSIKARELKNGQISTIQFNKIITTAIKQELKWKKQHYVILRTKFKKYINQYGLKSLI
jgi:hypothetical protein